MYRHKTTGLLYRVKNQYQDLDGTLRFVTEREDGLRMTVSEVRLHKCFEPYDTPEPEVIVRQVEMVMVEENPLGLRKIGRFLMTAINFGGKALPRH